MRDTVFDRLDEQRGEDKDAFADLPDFTPAEKGAQATAAETIYGLGFDRKKFEARCRLHYMIEEKKSGLLKPWGPMLKTNPPQLRMLRTLLQLAKRGGPVRMIIVKDRKVGISTGVGVWGLDCAQQIPNFRMGIVAHTEDSTTTLFNIVRTAYEQLPTDMKTKYRSLTQDKIEFGERNIEKRDAGDHGQQGGIYVATAKGKYPFTSKTIRFLHMSECAKYDAVGDMDDQMKFILSAMGSMPKQGPSVVIAESTANGQQGWFYETWKRAIQNKASVDGQQWVPYFVSWLDDPSTRMPVPKGYDWEDWPDVDKAHEKMLAEHFKATPENLLFRRDVIYNEMGNDAVLFDQEFPTTWEGAFLASGRPAVNPATLDRQKTFIDAPKGRYEAEITDTTTGLDYQIGDDGETRSIT